MKIWYEVSKPLLHLKGCLTKKLNIWRDVWRRNWTVEGMLDEEIEHFVRKRREWVERKSFLVQWRRICLMVDGRNFLGISFKFKSILNLVFILVFELWFNKRGGASPIYLSFVLNFRVSLNRSLYWKPNYKWRLNIHYIFCCCFWFSSIFLFFLRNLF